MDGEDWQSWIEAFRIFEKYGGTMNRAIGRHDCVFAGPSADEISPEDHERLKQLGWYISPDTRGFARYT